MWESIDLELVGQLVTGQHQRLKLVKSDELIKVRRKQQDGVSPHQTRHNDQEIGIVGKKRRRYANQQPPQYIMMDCQC